MLPAPTAYLRVYEPLSSFGEDERSLWETDASTSDETRARTTMVESEMLAGSLVRPGSLVEVESDRAFVLVREDQTFVCPWRTRLRSLQTLIAFRESVPDVVAEAFCPGTVADALSEELEGWRRLHPGRRSHVLSSTWIVPVRWFVAFEPVERSVVTQAGPGRSLIYQSDMPRVRRRVGRALNVVRESFGRGGPTSEVEVLERWLDQFHPNSVVELDYGRLVDLLDDEALRSDESAADVMDSLDALERGDMDQAGAAYQRVVLRWQSMAGLERAS